MKAVELDPLSGNAHFSLGQGIVFSGQVDQGIKILRYARELAPKHLPSIRNLVWAYLENGMLEESLTEIKKGLSLFPNDSWLQSDMGHIYALRGEKAKTRAILDELLERLTKAYVPFFSIASLYSYLGEIDQSFEYLDKGYERRELTGYFDIKQSFLSRVLRTDPRYISFLKKMGLEP